MQSRIFFLTSLLLLLFVGPAVAQRGNSKPSDQESVASTFAQIAQLGPGVHRIKLDAEGQVQSCIVVGQTRISTVLGTAKGLQTARTRAQLATAGEFVKWLNRDVSVHEKSEDETVLYLEGNHNADKHSLQESSKAVEKDTIAFSTISKGLVRGLQVLHVEVSQRDQTYTVVMGWSADGAAAARQAAMDESLPPVPRSSAGQTRTAGSIPSRQATSDEAGKFLDPGTP